MEIDDSPNININETKKEEEKKDNDKEDNKLDTSSTSPNKMKTFKKMKTTNLSSFPELISMKENPQTDKIEEKKDLDKKLWIPDEDAQNCFSCGSKFFSLFNRKHHCRVCGNIFCKSCLESFYEITIYNEKQELKVCAYCLAKKRELNNRLKKDLVEYIDDKGNRIFKTKTWDYVNIKNRNKDKIDTFCGFNKNKSQLLQDFHDNLNKNYENLLEKMIYRVLNEKTDKMKFPNLAEDWSKIIYNLINKVINNLSPTFQNLNDSININDYLKIKTLEFRDKSICEVIDGYAMKKNVCIKNMRTDIDNPSILILQGSLEGLRTNRIKTNTTNNIIIKSSAEEAYFEIIRKKIRDISPNIILVEGNVLQKFQTYFAMEKINISLINKVDLKKLDKIARCVNTIVVPSPDLLGKHIVLGSCRKFKIQKIKSNPFIENINNVPHLKKGDYHLMRFEGCGKILFNTVILSGPNKDELKELKRLMKIIAKTARFLYCQKFLLKYFNMLYEPSITNSQENKNEINKIKNRRKNSMYRENYYFYGFDTDIIDDKNNEFDCIYMSLQNKNKNDNLNISMMQKCPSNTSSEFDKTSLNMSINNPMSLKESQVLKSTPNQCLSCSYTMNAYSIANDEERTLGQNILSFLEEAKDKCEKCGDNKINHTSFIYKSNGRIKISVYNLNEQIYFIDKIAEFLGFKENSSNTNKKKEFEDDEMYSYGFCEQCNQIVTPIVILPEEIMNFSATKFYQNILYNKKMINFGDEHTNILNFDSQKKIFELISNEDAAYNCSKLKHLHYRDISRIFMTKNGVVKFKYEEIIKYKLLGSQLNTNMEFDIKENKRRKTNEIAKDKMLTLNALESLKNKFIVHKNILESSKTELFSDVIDKTKKVIDEGIERIEELKKNNDQIFEDESEYENIFVYNNNLRKYLLKIMNIKIICNKLLKVIKRIIKHIFFEEVEELNKKWQEAKVFELSPKVGVEEANNNVLSIKSKTLSEDNKNIKDLELLNKEQIPEQEDGNPINKIDLSLKTKTLSFPSLNNNNNNININNINNSNSPENKLNLSNSSSISDVEEKEEDNNENNKAEENLNLNFEDSEKKLEKIETGENDIKEEEEKDKPKEDISNKVPEISLKKSLLGYSFFNSNPELKENINGKYNSCLNEINKYVNNILELEKNGYLHQIICKLNYYDKNHSLYSVDVNEEDICSLISYALTSDQYLDSVKMDNKNGLNEIKSHFINSDNNSDDDNDLYCETSLLYDIDKVKFSLGNLSNEKISQILKNELINNENKKCIYELKYNPSQVFNEVFEKKSKKANKTSTNSKINYTDFNQKLYQINYELKNIKTEIKKFKERFDEIKKRFDFPKYESFEEDKLPTTELKITIFYTKHFESFRILYGASYFDFLHSIIKSQEWSSVTGGKSKAHFFKSWDEKFVVKCLSELEFNMFINSCFHYFVHNNKYFFFKMPSSLVKVVGAYRIKINSTKKNVIYCVIMENLNYLLKAENASIITYDLKGSEINRYIKNKDNDRVLMDTNFVEDFGGEPLALDQKIYTLFLCAISNDTKICRNMEVIDYSLLCIIIDYKEEENKGEEDEKNKYLKKIYNKGDNEGKVKFIRLGVLDYFRKYTSDKQLETLVKTIMNKFNTPTVINPKKYDERFFKKLSSYFIGS